MEQMVKTRGHREECASSHELNELDMVLVGKVRVVEIDILLIKFASISAASFYLNKFYYNIVEDVVRYSVLE